MFVMGWASATFLVSAKRWQRQGGSSQQPAKQCLSIIIACLASGGLAGGAIRWSPA